MLNHTSIADRLVALRGKANQADVAKQMGIAQATLSNWENGTIPSAESIAKLARHYGVSADYLVLLTDYPSGLAPDSWIVDLDRLESGTGTWAAKVPRRHRVVDHAELERLKEEQEKQRGRKSRLKGDGDGNV